MSHKPLPRKLSISLPVLSSLVLLFLLAIIGLVFKTSNPDLEGLVHNVVKKEEALSRMRVDLLKSADIEKGAVMADTDELSRTLAQESLRAAEAVERGRIELGRLIEHDHVDREMSLLHEFDSCWAELQKIDKVLLDFAVENTNLKASNLSFTQSLQAIDRFKQSLVALEASTSSSPDDTEIRKLACDGLTAAFEIQCLHAPHIASANDQDMDRIETQIRQLDEKAQSSLKEMAHYVPEGNQALMQDATSAYGEFQRLTAEVLSLSRKNTNIKSFELSLGRKRKMTSQCDEALASLQETVRSRRFEATR